MATSYELEIEGEAKVRRQLEQLADDVFFAVTDKATRKASNVVAKRARQLAPRSKLTGSAAKRSSSQRSEANWDIPLHTTITTKIVKKDSGAVGVIGPKWPDGNKAFFNHGKRARRVVYWGRPQGTVYRGSDFLKRALDESVAQVESVYTDTVRAEIRKVSRG